jgi:hypothetical protein
VDINETWPGQDYYNPRFYTLDNVEIAFKVSRKRNREKLCVLTM